jgi:hypothetical protein
MVTAALEVPVTDPLLVRLTVEPLSTELTWRPAPVRTAPLFTVAFTLAENVWMRSVVSGFGELMLPVLVVAKVPLQVNVTGLLPVVAQSAHALELTNDAEMKTADAAAERVRPPSLTLLLNASLRLLRELPSYPRDCLASLCVAGRKRMGVAMVKKLNQMLLNI